MPIRTDPATVLPPDRVMVCTTPPWNRPYSAGTDPVHTRVSSTASWMKNGRARPRVFSFAGRPSTRKRFPYENAPAMTRALVRTAPADARRQIRGPLRRSDRRQSVGGLRRDHHLAWRRVARPIVLGHLRHPDRLGNRRQFQPDIERGAIRLDGDRVHLALEPLELERDAVLARLGQRQDVGAVAIGPCRHAAGGLWRAPARSRPSPGRR